MPMHQEYRDLWRGAGYSSGMGSAAVTRPPPDGFIRVYCMAPACYALENIKESRLKLASFDDLNDPFELMALQLRQDTRAFLKGFKQEAAQDFGLLCFSADWTNPVLWSHYADRHRGICLGFDVNKEIIEEVIYEEGRIKHQWKDDSSAKDLSDELQQILFKTKYKSWSYEREHRVLVPLDDQDVFFCESKKKYFFKLNERVKLKEVIFGWAFGDEDGRKIISEKFSDGSVVVFSARLAHNYFSVVPKESTVP